jgi:hypothetical protein
VPNTIAANRLLAERIPYPLHLGITEAGTKWAGSLKSAVGLGALLADGGSWSVEQGLGRPTASEPALRMVLAPRLEDLPAPAVTLRLRALALGPPAAEQIELSVRGHAGKDLHRLGDAARQVRAAQGAEALLKVMPVDPASRVPERRAALTPYRP